MVAESGARLLDEDAQQALIAEILPRASVLTPNVPEALVLVGERSAHGALKPAQGASDGDAQDARELGDEDAERLAQAVLALGPRAVVLTGGHRARAVDLFCSGETGEEIVEIAGERHPGGAAHGSGCTHSSVLAARLARGDTPLAAARVARELAGEAVANGLRDLGRGAGPVDVLGLSDYRS